MKVYFFDSPATLSIHEASTLAGQGPMLGGGPDDAAAKALDGVFTLTTDAEIVSQNQEDGASVTPRGRQLRWIIKPMTTEAPMAVLRLQPR